MRKEEINEHLAEMMQKSPEIECAEKQHSAENWNYAEIACTENVQQCVKANAENLQQCAQNIQNNAVDLYAEIMKKSKANRKSQTGQIS